MAASKYSKPLFQTHLNRLAKQPIAALLSDASRNETLTIELSGVFADFRKQALDTSALEALVAWADKTAWRSAAKAMADGAIINATEQRSVQHIALRSLNPPQSFKDAFQQMRALVDSIRSNKRLTDFIHVGIGGSHLGPQLVCEALANSGYPAGPRIHFLANIDGHQLINLLPKLNPDTTGLIIASKTLTTLETRLNAETILDWLGPERRARQVFAVSAAPQKAAELGISPKNVLPFSDSIGGRFSLWSPIGLPIALQIGWDGFDELLAGARAMDEHFLLAPSQRNMPLLMALLGIWNRNGLGHQSLSIAPYDERLRLLSSFLQQLEMESNGKTVAKDGKAVGYATSPILWGQTGTPGQHAYFQWLHHGTDIAPVDFVACTTPDHPYANLHAALLENCFAQSRALMLGRTHDDPNRAFTGNRPSSTLLLNRLTASTLGTLIALYEHKVFVQGHLWNINSFDQFGVELGKAMATELGGLDAGSDDTLDDSTRDLLQRVRAQS